MKYRLMSSPMTKFVGNNLIYLPTPSSINYLWMMGSMMGLLLTFQIIVGVMLAMNYSTNEAFSSVIHICRDVIPGMEMRFLHSTGASAFFFLIYVHIFRGILYMSLKKTEVLASGVVMLFSLMGTGFLGYTLPWGQMSFWGGQVITSFLSISEIGRVILQAIRGGLVLAEPTLQRFFTIHYILPFIILGLVVLHLISLHNIGSSNTMGTNSNQDKINFHPFFTFKDFLHFILLMVLLTLISTMIPYTLMDCNNFSAANPMNTPLHIVPEWYFLFAYAILRSIPNKLAGLMLMLSSLLVLMMIPMKMSSNLGFKFSMIHKMKCFTIMLSFLLLTWLGAMPLEPVFITTTRVITIMYFLTVLSL